VSYSLVQLLQVANKVSSVGKQGFLAGPVDREPRHEGNRLVLYNFQPTLATITSALNAAVAPLRDALTEALASGYSKENVRKELAQGLVLEVGVAFPALDEVEGKDGLEGPAEAVDCSFGPGKLDCP